MTTDKIEFNGKNAKDIETFLNKNGVKLIQKSNGQLLVIDSTIFKDDILYFENGKLVIKKPSYITGVILRSPNN